MKTQHKKYIANHQLYKLINHQHNNKKMNQISYIIKECSIMINKLKFCQLTKTKMVAFSNGLKINQEIRKNN